jgi:hypothetical protein
MLRYHSSSSRADPVRAKVAAARDDLDTAFIDRDAESPWS